MDKKTIIYASVFTVAVAIIPGTVVAALLVLMEPTIWHIAISIAVVIPIVMLLPRYKTLGRRIVVDKNQLLVTRWGSEKDTIEFRDVQSFSELVGTQLGFEIALRDGGTHRIATYSPTTHKKLKELLISRCHA